MLVELRKKWFDERCIQPPVTLNEIVTFEHKYGVRLPNDLREYFLASNGTKSDGDKNSFEFFPLNKFLPWDQTLWKDSVHAPLNFDSREYFVFADYLQSSWGYAIQLCLNPGEGGKVRTCGWVIDKVVAGSFIEFVRLYLDDAQALYPPTPSNSQ